jgi:hypothetical protein
VNRRPRGWHAKLDPDSPFVAERDFSIDWTWPRSVDEVVGSFGTYSGSIIRSEAEQRELSENVRAMLLERFPDGVVELPMTFRGTTARRRPR